MTFRDLRTDVLHRNVLVLNDYFSSRRVLIDRFLAELRPHAPAPLEAPLRRALASAGKRVRGVLTLAVGETIGAKPERLVPAAAAMEMIHASSLILDDLPAMDDALLRRGAPTLHREFGEDLAILAAVALLNHSYALVAQAHTDCSPRRWPMQQVMQRVVDAVGWDGTIAGEAVDLHSEGSSLDFDTLEFIHSRKTGALFVASAAVGGMLANIHTAPLQRIEVFAKNLGLALHNYHDTHNTLPFGYDQRGLAWSGLILPQIEQAPLYNSLIFQESGPGNWGVAARWFLLALLAVGFFVCLYALR